MGNAWVQGAQSYSLPFLVPGSMDEVGGVYDKQQAFFL